MAGDVSPVELRIEGADKLDLVASRLKRTGGAELRRELFKGLNRAAAPLKAVAQDSAQRGLPRRGGLAARVAGAKYAVRTRGSGRNVGVQIVASGGANLRSLDRGFVRHPVFGNRAVWVTQAITPGWFTQPLEGEAPAVRRELVRALDDMAKKVTTGV